MSERTDHEIVRLLQELIHLEKEQIVILHRIEHNINQPSRVDHYDLTQTGDTVREKQLKAATVIGIAPGGTGTFKITPLDENDQPVALPLTFEPTVTTDDTTNAPVVQIANADGTVDGLNFTITVPASFVPAPGAVFQITIANPDGTGASTYPVPYESSTPPPPPFDGVASYGLTQIS